MWSRYTKLFNSSCGYSTQRPRKIIGWVERWNGKFHIYIGLYLLLFVWLFSITGLLLNHPKWRLSQFWSERKQTSFEQPIRSPMGTGNLAKAKALMRQLKISGEIDHITISPEKQRFDFRVIKPGKIIDVKANLNKKHAIVEQIQVDTRGIMNMLHSFTGVRMDEPGKTRDWLMTKLWSLSMDVLSIGLCILVFGGIYLWYQVKPERILGFLVLGLGILICAFFVFGLAWI